MFIKKFICLILTLNVMSFSNVSAYAQDNQSNQEVKGSLVVVGDAMLAYASYFFILPENWVPEIDNTLLTLTNQKGFWRGKYKNSQAWILIAPTRTERENGHFEFIKTSKNLVLLKGCSLKNYSFTPSFTYSYEAHLEYCPKINRYGLILFAKLPTHVINFNLYVTGENENCLIPFLEDFNKVIASFRWTLGLSDDEIGNMFKEFQQSSNSIR